MNYYQLKDRKFSDYGMTACPRLDDDFPFRLGQYISGKPPELHFEVSYPSIDELPHFIEGEIPIVSQSFADMLTQAGVENFQLFPAVVKNPETGDRWENYYALNILGLLQAADMDNSEFDILMEGSSDGVDIPLVMFDTLKIDSSKAQGTPLFRLAESPNTIIIDETIYNAIVEMKPDGGWKIGIVNLQMD